MTDKEWETLLKDTEEEVKKWADEEMFKIKYNIIKNIIEKEKQND